MTLAYIALGSNLQSPKEQVESALHAISELPDTDLIKASAWYRTAPIGPGDQPDYINGVCAIETALEPLPLLKALQQIENDHGRERTLRWGARTLDLDILLYRNDIIDHPDLQVPHPRMAERNFVLVPLADVAPTLTFPSGQRLTELLANCPAEGIVRL